MFKKITTQTKSQGKVIDFLNKPYDNCCKNAKKDKKTVLSSFNPLCFLKTFGNKGVFFWPNQRPIVMRQLFQAVILLSDFTLNKPVLYGLYSD